MEPTNEPSTYSDSHNVGNSMSPGASPSFDDWPEKARLPGKAENMIDSRKRLLSDGRLKPVLLFTILVSCLPLLWLASSYLPPNERQGGIDSISLDIVRHAVPASSASTQTPTVQEDFQVYQPVLTPSGTVDETVLANGVENTTTIAESPASTSCEVLLMEHSFGNSYGSPFVGKLPDPGRIIWLAV